jgi:hypothetical protein
MEQDEISEEITEFTIAGQRIVAAIDRIENHKDKLIE